MIDVQKELIDAIKEQFIAESKSANDALQTGTKGTLEFAKIALNSCFLLNAGAALALLYNAKHLGNSWKTPLVFCIIGALLSVFASGMAYLTQSFLVRHYANEMVKQLEYASKTLAMFITSYPLKEQQPAYTKSHLPTGLLLVTCGLFVMSCLCSCAALLSFLFIM